jgi:hypothetical protein
LVRWDILAKPKKCGGWGFKNIFIFTKALAAKIMWRSLFGNGLWYEVINKKHLKIIYVIDWLRKGKTIVKGMSNCWKALYDSLTIVTDWLAWKPGTGKDIRVGLDPLIGSHYYYKLSESLISLLHSKGIFTLD